MSIVKCYDKRTGTTYCYESINYWDKEKKKPASKRTLIGKIDPATGEMVPTGGRGRPKKKATDAAGDDGSYKSKFEEVSRRLDKCREEVKSLRSSNAELKAENDQLRQALSRIHKLSEVT